MTRVPNAKTRYFSRKTAGLITFALFISVLAFGLGGAMAEEKSSTSSVTRNSISVEIVETAPDDMDNPNIQNTYKLWLELFENAENTIDIEAHYFNDTVTESYGSLCNELKTAAERGVQIRILTDEWTVALDSLLRDEENIQVKIAEFDIHSKYFVVDNRKVFVGSQNWSNGGIQLNHELGVLIENNLFASSYTYIFESGWSAAGGENRGSKYWETDWLYPVVSGPEMPARTKSTPQALTNLIDYANENVKIFNYSFSSGADSIAQALRNAAKENVKVQLMVDAFWYENTFEYIWPNMSYSSYVDFSERIKTLDSVNGINVKGINLGDWKAAHQKMFVVDGKRAYVGSANLATKSMGTNSNYWRREVGVITNDITLGTALNKTFEDYWNSEYSKKVKSSGESSEFVISEGMIILAACLAASAIIIVWVVRTVR